jgi:predicted nucleic acid-binding protein
MIVVADTSVILNLCCVEQAHLLPGLFHEVWIPDEVRIEFERLAVHQPRFQGLRLPDWALIRPAAPVSAALAAMANLHAGETAALALALDGHADAVLMDESAGRHAAKLLGLPVIGVLGVLLQARRSGLLPAIKPVLQRLEIEAGFWLSPVLVAEALRKSGET